MTAVLIDVADCADDTAAVLGQHVLDELLSEREKINSILQEIIDEATTPWGIKVARVELKDLEIPSGIQQAMPLQAEAEANAGRRSSTPRASSRPPSGCYASVAAP